MADEFVARNIIDPSKGWDVSQLQGKSVVVTGGASGLGEEMARHFVKAGAFVTIGDLSSERGKEIVAELGEDHAAFSQCNVTTWTDQVQLFKTAISRSPTKQINIVVANAGISGADTVWRDDAEGADAEPIEPDLSILNTNLIGVMYTAKLAVHYLSRNTEGSDRCLIMTASLAGYLDQPGSPQYNASKWGVRGIMRSLRRTCPRYGMRVNIIAPWFVKTNIMSEKVKDLVSSKGVQWADKADVAAAVLHLASDRNINGRALCNLPREEAPQGYKDLEQDDFVLGSDLEKWQGIASHASHRVGTGPK